MQSNLGNGFVYKLNFCARRCVQIKGGFKMVFLTNMKGNKIQFVYHLVKSTT